MGYTTPRLLSRDADAGVTQFFHPEPDGSFVIETQQDVSAILELNKAAQAERPRRWGEWTRVASMPLSIWLQLKEQGVLDDEKAYRKWLNDIDNAAFRTRSGKV